MTPVTAPATARAADALRRTEAPCIAGPTASGKTAAALAVAATLPCEIISVDSALVYRGMDIGTAKPSAAERAQVPHHLIDIRDPRDAYSAAQFVADATRLIGEIRARGRLPLLVGGTLLYFKALFDGLDDMPPADAAVRAEIEAQARERSWPAMHAELARVDAVTAARLAPNDSQRIQRALEVWRITGQPLSALHARLSARGDMDRAHAAKPASPDRMISLEPADRAWLHQRIAERFDAMLAAGFIDEVRALRARGDLSPDLPSMRCVGYRQAWEWLDAQHDGTAPSPAERLRQRGIEATRQLAKRQITWLRSMPARTVIDAQQPDAAARVVRQVQAWVQGDAR
ncbi:MAG: tRNA (adenosine(37)-N6)-dimethylallyltransferase MiaA [Burkholderiaceae bacterium]